MPSTAAPYVPAAETIQLPLPTADEQTAMTQPVQQPPLLSKRDIVVADMPSIGQAKVSRYRRVTKKSSRFQDAPAPATPSSGKRKPPRPHGARRVPPRAPVVLPGSPLPTTPRVLFELSICSEQTLSWFSLASASRHLLSAHTRHMPTLHLGHVH